MGGILKSEQAIPFKHEMYELAGTYAALAINAGVEIRLNTEATAEYVEREGADALIIAVGSEPFVPPVPGLKGDNVILVEMRDQLAPDANVRHRPLLLEQIQKYVTVHTGCRGLEVRPDGILCEKADGTRKLVPGTTVVCALGQRSRRNMVDSLRDAAPYVAVIGDAAKVSNITNAVYWGYHAALDI